MQAIEKLIEEYARAWSANDAGLLETFWDTDDPQPLYKAEEIEDYFADWDALRAYWQHNQTMHEHIELEARNFVHKPLAEGLVLTTFRMRWDILFAADAGEPAVQWRGKAMGGDNHVLALARDTADGWRLAAWNETPLAALTYITQLYLANVKPGFGAPP